LQGRVEELLGIDLRNYAIGAAEDCSKKLDMFFNFDVLDAIQRSASKPWVSETPYMKNACTPDLSVLLIDSRKLEGDFVEAFLWWSKVLNLSERFEISPCHFKQLILFSYIRLNYCKNFHTLDLNLNYFFFFFVVLFKLRN
jgi:hypothetical protein